MLVLMIGDKCSCWGPSSHLVIQALLQITSKIFIRSQSSFLVSLHSSAILENWLVEVLPVLVLISTEYAQQEKEEVEEIKVERERA